LSVVAFSCLAKLINCHTHVLSVPQTKSQIEKQQDGDEDQDGAAPADGRAAHKVVGGGVKPAKREEVVAHNPIAKGVLNTLFPPIKWVHRLHRLGLPCAANCWELVHLSTRWSTCSYGFCTQTIAQQPFCA
jgi:hypothetical protein